MKYCKMIEMKEGNAFSVYCEIEGKKIIVEKIDKKNC